MNDLHILDEAFAELERRADLAPATAPDGAAARGAPSHRSRALVVAAAVVVVAAVAGGTVLVSQRAGDGPSTNAAAPPSTATTSPATTTPTTTTSSPVATTSPSPSATTSPTAAPVIPSSPAALARRFRSVLGARATITVTETAASPGDPYIKGVLTAASGARGGYDFQILDAGRGSAASCEDPGSSVCHVRRLPDGSSLSVGTESGGGELYLVNLVRPDGTSFLWHLSTRTDPKGSGDTLGSRPPLTTTAMATILENGQW